LLLTDDSSHDNDLVRPPSPPPFDENLALSSESTSIKFEDVPPPPFDEGALDSSEDDNESASPIAIDSNVDLDALMNELEMSE